jgi:preprotein translocase subunit YajC
MIPHTDYERLALLEEIERGDKVVIPTSMEHAKFMMMIAQHYINEQHNNTINALKADYDR